MSLTSISVSELQRRLAAGDSLQLLDIRSHGEYVAEHIPHAVNIPMERCEARLDDLHSDRPVVLICQSGRRATMTHSWLSADRPNALILEGGTSAWKQAGLPIVSEQATHRWSLERQTRLGAGLLILLGLTLAATVDPLWLGLVAFVGMGLTFAGATDICLMGILLTKAPWNRPAKSTCATAPAGSAS